MPSSLERLLGGGSLDREQAKSLLRDIALAAYNPSQIAAVLTVFRMRPVEATELRGFRDAMLELAMPLNLGGLTAIDVCGTGGDDKHTFNISTLAAFAVAGAGIPVVKHGNYSASSACGSSNLLEALKVPFPKDETNALRHLRESGIVFLHAPLWHPAMKNVAPVRRELGFRTVFNLLGPLVNPARPPAQLIGVFSPEVQTLYSKTLRDDGRQYTIVHSCDGYDEVSLTGPFDIVTPAGKERLSPQDLGLERVAPKELLGGKTIEDAAEIALRVLSGKGTTAQHNVVAANAGVAIRILKPETALPECVAMAQESLSSGRALAVLEKVRGL